MKVIVVGCGRVGAGLAVSLDQSGHSVSVIDKNAHAFHRLPQRWSGRAVLGYGIDMEHLEQAGAREASAFAAVTSGDNTNILCARIARETFDIPNVVARIYDPRRAVIFQRLGISTVATVTWTTDQVMRRLLPELSTVDWLHSSGEMSLIERNLPTAWAGKRLDKILTGTDYRLIAVTRGGKPLLAISDTLGQQGDILHLMIKQTALPDLEQLFTTDSERQS